MNTYEMKHWMSAPVNLHILPKQFREQSTERMFAKLQLLHNEAFYAMYQRILRYLKVPLPHLL